MRLLYVALTRAADRLIVSGVAPKAKKDGSDPRPQNCWHRIVEQAMTAMGAAEIDRGKWGRSLLTGSAAGRRVKWAAKVAQPPIAVPDWATMPAPPEARPPRPLAPSAIVVDDQSAPPPSEAMRAAARRGTLIHQLLDRLVGVDSNTREASALSWLERVGGVTDAGTRQQLAAQVCAILADPAYSDLFGPGSIGEAPLAATLPDGRVIAGTVDRLLVEQDRVSVIDFKTGGVPDDAAHIPPSHRAQMLAYSEALRVIFPGREVRAALLYTSGPVLFELHA
jgi:ATP-dependent helicase/nuclease subunit A